MKKLVSVFLMLSMLLSMFTTVSAGTIAEGTSFVPNPMDLSLTVSVGARETNTANDYVYPPGDPVSVTVGPFAKGIDYRAKLDMSTIRDLFGEGYIQFVLVDDAEAKDEFDAGIVSTTVNVLIEYPSAIIVNDNIDLMSEKVGSLDAGSIFSEKARVENGNTLKITYVNKSNLTVKELQPNIDTYLKDITFTLDNVFSYSEAGNHIVKVTLSGETLLKFKSKEQRVIYSGTASNVVNVAKNDVTNHELEVIPVTPATCFEPGKTEGIICRTHNSFGDCGALGTKSQTDIARLNHMSGGKSLKVPIDGETASCTKKGIKPHWTCSLCKSDFDTEKSDEVKTHDSYVLPKLEHTKKTLSRVDATCTNEGLSEGEICSVCNTITKTQAIIPARHDPQSIPAVIPTCTEEGSTQGVQCRKCFITLTPQLDIPATGHKFGEWKITVEATESSKGSMERICANCDVKETRDIEKKPHTCVALDDAAVVTKEPTCTEKGEKQNYCACGKPVGAPVAIPAKGHTTEKVGGTPATCVAEGVTEHYKCVICDDIFRDKEATNPLKSAKTPVDKTNHGGEENYVKIKGIPSTCIHQGFDDDGEKCKNCNIIVKPQSVLDLAHHITKPIDETPATCEGHGVKAHWHCEVCNKDFKDKDGNNECSSYELDIPALGHKYGEAIANKDADPDADGHVVGTKTCEKCSDIIDVKVFVGEEKPCPHAETLIAITKNATCTENGKQLKICLSCGIETGDAEDIPMTAHNLKLTPSVSPTCHTKGTEAYYTCLDCGKMFNGTDASKEIAEIRVLAEITHDFSREIGNGNNLKCRYCNEVLHVKKKDAAGNEVDNGDIQVNNKNVGIKKEQDKIKENTYADIEENITIESEIIISDREEVSETLDEAITNTESTTVAAEIVDKVAWDIEINKVTTYKSGEEDREPIPEIDGLIEIVIPIPEILVDSVDFLVHRLHINEGKTEKHIITTKENLDGEKIDVNKAEGTITLKVKKFSEYVLVGYATVVNVEENESSSPSSASTPSKFTVQFKANGGTSVSSISVKKGNKITAPSTTRDGYVFAGWYVDADFTEKFDFNKPITRNMTLYAKWEKVGAEGTCDGTAAGGCVSCKFKDVNTSLWYHAGIDFAIQNGLMKGVSEDMFAPDANITRGMLVTVLGRREGVEDKQSGEAVFSDVSVEQYYASHINWAVENNIVNGYGDGLFGPDDFVTREQVAAIIHRYAKHKGYDVSAGESTSILSYDDYNGISEYAIPSVQYVVGSGLMKGKTDTTFNPVDNSTRAEIATILQRFIEANQ